MGLFVEVQRTMIVTSSMKGNRFQKTMMLQLNQVKMSLMKVLPICCFYLLIA